MTTSSSFVPCPLLPFSAAASMAQPPPPSSAPGDATPRRPSRPPAPPAATSARGREQTPPSQPAGPSTGHATSSRGQTFAVVVTPPRRRPNPGEPAPVSRDPRAANPPSRVVSEPVRASAQGVSTQGRDTRVVSAPVGRPPGESSSVHVAPGPSPASLAAARAPSGASAPARPSPGASAPARPPPGASAPARPPPGVSPLSQQVAPTLPPLPSVEGDSRTRRHIRDMMARLHPVSAVFAAGCSRCLARDEACWGSVSGAISSKCGGCIYAGKPCDLARDAVSIESLAI